LLGGSGALRQVVQGRLAARAEAVGAAIGPEQLSGRAGLQQRPSIAMSR
jgi:hypothetical protein